MTSQIFQNMKVIWKDEVCDCASSARLSFIDMGSLHQCTLKPESGKVRGHFSHHFNQRVGNRIPHLRTSGHHWWVILVRPSCPNAKLGDYSNKIFFPRTHQASLPAITPHNHSVAANYNFRIGCFDQTRKLNHQSRSLLRGLPTKFLKMQFKSICKMHPWKALGRKKDVMQFELWQLWN